MRTQIERAIEITAIKISGNVRADDAARYADACLILARTLAMLDSCDGSDGIKSIIEKLSTIETNLGAKIMATKDEVLATIAAETQEVLDKINADRAEIDAAQAALTVKAEEVAAAQSALEAKTAEAVALQARIDELVAGGTGATAEDLTAIQTAVAAIFNP